VNYNYDFQLTGIKGSKKRGFRLVYIILIMIAIIIPVCIAMNIAIKQHAAKPSSQIAAKTETVKKTGNEAYIAQLEKMNTVIAQKKDEALEIVEKIRAKKMPVLTDAGKDNIKHIYASPDKVAYLTFDDGPSKTITSQLLDVLKENKIKATFFVLGNRVDLYPDIVKREYDEGHYVANHGYSHVYKSIYQTPYTVLDEYNKTENSIKQALGLLEYNSHLFRFPGGSTGGSYASIKSAAKTVLDENDVTYVDWNALTGDGDYQDPTRDILINSLTQTMQDKTSLVILMHDSSTKQITVDTLPEIINLLRDNGYTFKNFYDVME